MSCLLLKKLLKFRGLEIFRPNMIWYRLSIMNIMNIMNIMKGNEKVCYYQEFVRKNNKNEIIKIICHIDIF